MARRELTPGEEIANSVTHGAGACLAVAGLVSLAVPAARSGAVVELFSYTVYGGAAILLYVSSTLYHALTHVRAKAVLAVFDHSLIFAMIAGTYTPFSLVAIRGPWGWFLFVTSWVIAAAGITLAIRSPQGYRRTRVALYALAGWLILLAYRPALRAIGPEAMRWLVAGGLVYSVGIFLYAARRIRYTHTAWHLCVIAGSVLQFVALRLALQQRLAGAP